MAQKSGWRGVALGADRDSLMYIIASPFDNWYINTSIGVQTYIGNTPDNPAAWNKADLGTRVEIGKWVIPDVAVSLRLGFATAHSKSIHVGNNPLTDPDNAVTYDGAEHIYYPISAYLATAMGIVTFDWTNFFHGYEAGKRRHWHFYTPVGLGGIVMFGKIVNQNYVNKVNNNPDEKDVELGDFSRNFEFAFTGGMATEFFATKHISFNASLEFLIARGSLDDYNYNLDADMRHVDIIPSLYLGARFNLLKSVTKYNPYTHESSREKVNHEFLAYGTRGTIPNLNAKIERLYRERDSIQNLAGDRAHADSLRIDDIDHELDSIRALIDQLRNEQDKPRNIFDELLDVNEILNLPAAIVYYQLDKYDLDYNACKRLEDFAKVVRRLDDTTEYYIIGAADSVTGSIRHNQWLSERRSEAAYNMLVDTYGINANQLIRVNAGGINIYDPKENNRMAMIIQRTPITEEIVERWKRMSTERMKQ